MSIKAVLFDLDGTLLPMDQEQFVQAYLQLLAKKLAPHGYETKQLVSSIWAGTEAMIKNDGSRTNEAVLWDEFAKIYGEQVRQDEPLFRAYYENEFQAVQSSCGFSPLAAELIRRLKALNYRLVIATNPIFPAIATESRIRWAGLDKDDFELYTTYENSRHSKPNLDYYRDIMDALGLSAEECLMVGNDVQEDMITRQLGMKVFLLTGSLIDRENTDISRYPNGDFDELLRFIEAELT